ncbi:MAG: squalene/phytoene synthase family protein, partial [Hyphomicrobiales bacterium]|nr:squalene/phytoene synthase family protein [Hyphomicrobiales bacterium]
MDEATRGAFAHCEATLRDADRPRWLASLYAPAALRPRLHALGAFDAETAAIPLRAREPLAAAIRLRFWRDAIARGDGGDGHPTLTALEATIVAARLPRGALDDLLAARGDAFGGLPWHDARALEAHFGATAGVLIRLSALALAGDGVDPGGAATAGLAGVAVGLS